MKKYIFTFALLIFCNFTYSQSWEKIIPGKLDESVLRAWEMPDGGFVYQLIRGVNKGSTSLKRQTVLVRTDENFNVIWMKAAATTNKTFIADKLSNGEFMISSRYYSGRETGDDIEITKISSDGTELWKKVYALEGNQVIYNTIATNDGGLIVYITHQRRTYQVIKIKTDGTVEWRKTIAATEGERVFGIPNLSINSENALFLSWTAGNNDELRMGHVTKLNAEGNEIWDVELSEGYSDAQGLMSTPEGGCWAAVNNNLIVKLNELGEIIWEKKYPIRWPFEYFHFNQQDANRIGALIPSLHPRFKRFFFELDENGEIIKEYKKTTPGFKRIRNFIPLSNGEYLFYGGIERETTIEADAYFCKFNPKWNAQEEQEQQIINQAAAEKTVAKTSFELPEVLQPDIFVNAYPNPFTERLTFSFEGIDYQKVDISIFNIKGQLVFQQVYEQEKVELQFQDLVPGMYVYRVHIEGQEMVSGQVIKQ